MSPKPLRVDLRVGGVPELVARARRDLAQILRETAADEEPRVAARLHEIAAVFETGQATDLEPPDGR